MTAAARAADARQVPPARQVRGRIRVPGDKSVSHRAVLFNAIAEGEALITNASTGADCASTVACLQAMGVDVTFRDATTIRVRGVGLHGLREPNDVLDCGNSGTTMRLLTGLLAGQDLFAVLSGDSSLRQRPMARVAEPLAAMGARVSGRDGNRLPPLVVHPSGRLHGVRHQPTVASAQVKSALLLAGLGADGVTTVVEPAPTRDHSERMLRAMGAIVEVQGRTVSIQAPERLQAADVTVPGDFSSAAFWLALACLHPDADVTIENVGVNPTRTGFLEVLRRMDADIQVENRRDVAGEPVADLRARSSRLAGVEVGGDLVALSIDEVPLIALLGTRAEGQTVVRDAKELQFKESDRLAAVAEGLDALGGNVTATEDGWLVRPGPLMAGQASSQGDHRIAMLLALAGTIGAGAVVEGAGAVDISYPSFWETLAEVAR